MSLFNTYVDGLTLPVIASTSIESSAKKRRLAEPLPPEFSTESVFVGLENLAHKSVYIAGLATTAALGYLALQEGFTREYLMLTATATNIADIFISVRERTPRKNLFPDIEYHGLD
jgi:hypothetical protein